MELNNRLELLMQAAEIAQKNGVLSLDDAVVVKSAIDSIKEGKSIKGAVNILIKIAQIAQSKGAFSLKDAFYLYMAIDGIDKELDENELDKNEDTEKGEE